MCASSSIRIGDSSAIAQKLYLQVTDADFDRAAKAVKKPVQKAFDGGGQELPEFAQVVTGDNSRPPLPHVGNFTYYTRRESNP